jgi:prepilin-type processing-associated H-X9-DG protein
LRDILTAVFAVGGVFAITSLFGRFGLMVLPFSLMISLAYLGFKKMIGVEAYSLGIAASVVLPYLVLCVLYSVVVDPVAHNYDCRSAMKNIVLGLREYHDEYGAFPPVQISDENGHPMHSWRVLILPYIGGRDLYERYCFDEPWNGPNNQKLMESSFTGYHCPAALDSHFTTNYVAVVGPETVWPVGGTRSVPDVTDGASDTVAVVEIHNSGIHWMEPRDLELSSMPLKVNAEEGRGVSSPHPRDKWGHPSRQTANVALVDGSVATVGNDTPSAQLRALLTIAGNESVDWEEIRKRPQEDLVPAWGN